MMRSSWRCWTPGGVKERRRWFEPAKMVQPWWFPVRQLDRQTFAADMLFNGAEEQNFPRKMPADAWFDFKGCDRFMVEDVPSAERGGSNDIEASWRGCCLRP
jgi:hypothetical protein